MHWYSLQSIFYQQRKRIDNTNWLRDIRTGTDRSIVSVRFADDRKPEVGRLPDDSNSEPELFEHNKPGWLALVKLAISVKNHFETGSKLNTHNRNTAKRIQYEKNRDGRSNDSS